MPSRLTPAQRAHRLTSETVVQHNVESYLTSAGWLWYHAPDNRPVTTDAGRRYVQNIRRGFPDVLSVDPRPRGTRLVALECKREVDSQPSPEQLDWLRNFAALGAFAAVVRPSSLVCIQRAILSRRLGWPPVHPDTFEIVL